MRLGQGDLAWARRRNAHSLEGAEVRTGQKSKRKRAARGSRLQANVLLSIHDAPDKIDSLGHTVMFNTICTHEYTLSMDVVH